MFSSTKYSFMMKYDKIELNFISGQNWLFDFGLMTVRHLFELVAGAGFEPTTFGLWVWITNFSISNKLLQYLTIFNYIK